jgi:hypothetical protein
LPGNKIVHFESRDIMSEARDVLTDKFLEEKDKE